MVVLWFVFSFTAATLVAVVMLLLYRPLPGFHKSATATGVRNRTLQERLDSLAELYSRVTANCTVSDGKA
jgi:hypothetical protein